MKKLTFIIILIGAAMAGVLVNWQYLNYKNKNLSAVSDFEECAAKGNQILECYPRQCRTPDGKMFVEDIGNELEKTDLIRVEKPRPKDLIASPLEIRGEARGFWFFEASFPVRLLDENGQELEINPPYIQTKEEWMTENFVQFQAIIEFEKPATKKGTLILQKDNPSGLPENADELIIPVVFY